MDSGMSIKHGLGIKRGLRTMYIKTALEGKTERNRKRTSKNSSLSFSIPLAVHVVYSSQGEGRLCRYSRQLNFKKRRIKKNIIGVCQISKILMGCHNSVSNKALGI